jgi:uncharacterized heparinase superfamily protein
MLETIGAAPGVKSDIDWPAVWRSSDEYRTVQAELQRLKERARNGDQPVDESDYAEFAASFVNQLRYATERTFQQYWRSPAYINSKALLTIGAVSTIGPRQPFRKLIRNAVTAHRLLLLHDRQHATRSPESDVRRVDLPLRDHIAHPTSHPDVRDPARAL